MVQPVNPYVAGPPLRGARGLFGRQETLGWVARGLRNPANNSLVLFGQRCIGKTTLLLQIQRALSTDNFLPVYFDLQAHTTRPLGQVLADLAGAVAGLIDLEPPDPQDFDDRGLFFQRTFLPRVYERLGQNRRLIFLLDEFEALDEASAAELPVTAAIKALFRFTRRLMAKDPHPAFIFVVGRRVEELTVDFTAQFRASLVREVWVLDRENAKALVRQAEAPNPNSTLRFTDQAVARILSLTNGHPYLTQLLCHQIWEQAYAETPRAAAPPSIDTPEVEAAVPSTLKAGERALGWLWDGLSLTEAVYTAALAEVIGEGEAIAEDRSIQLLNARAARLLTQKMRLSPRDLVRRRVLELSGEREYCFAIELLRRWVRENKPLRDLKDELDKIDPLAEQLFGIGYGFLHRHQWESAMRYFRDALETNPRHFRARFHLGETLLKSEQADEAVAELERAYKLDREETGSLLARALVAQARTRTEAEDEDGALAACERALQISPDEQAAQEIRNSIWMRRLETKAKSHERAEQWAKASAAYERLIAQVSDAESQTTWQAALERCRKEKLLVQLFDEGALALKNKSWRRAQRVFAQVVHDRPDYEMNGQLAARLLLRAVLQKPVRKYVRAIATLLAIALVTAAGVSYFRRQKESQITSPVELPGNWEHVSTYHFDANRDGNQEWIVLYRFDQPDATEHDSGPIAGVVYQPGGNLSEFTPYELHPQDNDYLCECACSATMEDVLSGLRGPEVVVRDRCGEEITKVSIFYWDAIEEKYLPQGHFSGDRVTLAMDKVTVDQRLPNRAQLALQYTYRPLDNTTYYQPDGQGILVMHDGYEVVFHPRMPEDVMLSPYPEKVVLAFYNHYTDAAEASKYFTQEAWERVEGCANDQCGCASDRDEIAHVRVIDLQIEDETYSQETGCRFEGYGPDHAAVSVVVSCERKDGKLDAQTSLKWRLAREDEHGRLKLVKVEQNASEEADEQ